jgi:hypothetical protein
MNLALPPTGAMSSTAREHSMDTRTPRQRLKSLGRAAAVATALVLSACDEPPPQAPTPPGLLSPVLIEGTWTGTLTDNATGVGELQLTAAGYDNIATGSFTLQFSGRPPLRGDVSAIVRGPANIVILLSTHASTDLACPQAGTMYRAPVALNGSRLSGTFSPVIPCPLLRGGTIELTRR